MIYESRIKVKTHLNKTLSESEIMTQLK